MKSKALLFAAMSVMFLNESNAMSDEMKRNRNDIIEFARQGRCCEVYEISLWGQDNNSSPLATDIRNVNANSLGIVENGHFQLFNTMGGIGNVCTAIERLNHWYDIRLNGQHDSQVRYTFWVIAALADYQQRMRSPRDCTFGSNAFGDVLYLELDASRALEERIQSALRRLGGLLNSYRLGDYR